MKPLIVIVFGTERHMDAWINQDVYPSSQLQINARPAVRIQHEQFDIRCVVIRDQSDYYKLRGVEIALLIEHEGFEPYARNLYDWQDFVRAMVR